MMLLRLCKCTHPNPTQCLMTRFNIEHSLAECLSGCNCGCHYFSGALIPAGIWNKYKQLLARGQEMKTWEMWQ